MGCGTSIPQGDAETFGNSWGYKTSNSHLTASSTASTEFAEDETVTHVHVDDHIENDQHDVEISRSDTTIKLDTDANTNQEPEDDIDTRHSPTSRPKAALTDDKDAIENDDDISLDGDTSISRPESMINTIGDDEDTDINEDDDDITISRPESMINTIGDDEDTDINEDDDDITISRPESMIKEFDDTEDTNDAEEEEEDITISRPESMINPLGVEEDADVNEDDEDITISRPESMIDDNQQATDTQDPTVNCAEKLMIECGFQAQDEYEIALMKYAAGPQVLDLKFGDSSFGGSEAEYQEEKDFENVLTGTEGEDVTENLIFKPRNCVCCGSRPGQVHEIHCQGQWLSTMNSQGTCKVYVHTTSHEVRSTRPAELLSDVEKEQDKIVPESKDITESTPALSFDTLDSLLESCRHHYSQNKVLLVTHPDLKSLSSSDSFIWLDTRPLVLPFAKTRMKGKDAAEKIRENLVFAMKNGKVAILDVQDPVPNFSESVFEKPHKNCLPRHIFNACKQNDNAKVIFNRAKGDGRPVVKEGFAMIMSSKTTLAKRQKTRLEVNVSDLCRADFDIVARLSCF